MISAQPAPLPPLSSDDSPPPHPHQHRRHSFEALAVYEGASPVPANRLFEAKALNLVPRPATIASSTRSSASPSSFFVSSSSSPSLPSGCQPAPRHDNDVARLMLSSTSDQHHREPRRVKGGSARGESFRVSTSNDRPKWTSSREGLSNSASMPSGVSQARPEKVISTSPQQQHKTRAHQNTIKAWRNDPSHVVNETTATIIARRQSLESSQSQARAPAVKSLGRSSTCTTETFSNAGSGINGSRGISSAVSVATSSDPEVLHEEIQRLQAALMNEFKGGNRFVGGAQFKASSAGRNRHHGGGAGGACGECLQVREALRRSRLESRELRGSLFRAGEVIKQLKLAEALRRRKANHGSSGRSRRQGLLSASSAAASNESSRRLVSFLLATSVGSDGETGGVGSSRLEQGAADADADETVGTPSRGSLLKRVQKLERELRLADFRNTRSMGAVAGAEHGRARKNGVYDEGRTRSDGTCSSSVRDWEDPPPCSKCSLLNDRLLGEATKVSGLITRIQEYQNEAERLQEKLVGMGNARAQAAELQEKVYVLTSHAEDQARAKDLEIERLVADLDRSRNQSMEIEEQASKASEHLAALREELASKESLLREVEKELSNLRDAVHSERASRELADHNLAALRRKAAEERAWVGQTKEKLETEKAARRHSESQAAAADLTHRRALKAALNNCIRLCVVAPTVNINLGDRSRSFCSGLPEERIRAFVEGSVLPRFTRVLLQPGSEGGSTSLPSSSNNNVTCGGGGGRTSIEAARNIVTPTSRVRSSPSRCSSSSSSSSSKVKIAAASPAMGLTAAAAIDDPAADQHCSAQSDDEYEGGGGGSEGTADSFEGSRQGQGDFDKWLRDLLVDMQTSIERHVACVFQTHTAASGASGSSISGGGGALSLRR